ncbi:hypothetical protein [Shewanella subflava]|uniref:Uncharacterized protein n=1 Tax=Shewanella subflava TaxID=2986476 RepID=A0ABT3IBW5_9GAMM|nr:hypothetical protein [Shewanella subflava]MCW3173537.1 hypothetical protein [Shewanella subflava]
MKNWLNKIIGRKPAPVRNKVNVDLRYQSHSFTLDDFKNASTALETANTDDHQSVKNESNEPDSAASNNTSKINLIK